MIQKVKETTWKDESGHDIPVKYVSPGNRVKERHAGTLLSGAKKLNKDLADFKAIIQQLCDDVYKRMAEEFRIKPDSKGNFTWFSFDRSVKIEVSINDRIEFDDLTIKACKEKLDEFLNNTLDSKQEFVKDLVTDAFSTTRGKLDTKKVMSLLKYRSKIKSTLFQEALDLLEASIRKPSSRTYFRIWERQEDGTYQNIDLNFSSI